MGRISLVGLVLLLCLSLIGQVLAQDQDGLTPQGAERRDDAAGVGPWIGSREQVNRVTQTLVEEQAITVVDASNLAQHRAFLSEGQKALFAHYPDTYKLHIYPSHRTHLAPQWLYDGTDKNRHSTTLVDDGNGLRGAWPGVPFPVPESGLQVLWNHLTHWRGISAEIENFETTVHEQGAFSLIRGRIFLSMPYYWPDREALDHNATFLHYMTFTTAPASLAGGGLLVRENVNSRLQPRKAWVYNVNEKRVRRLPSLDYDMVNFNSESIRFVDEVDLFNGAPDRYNWKLVGKQPMYVPYNAQALAKQLETPESLLKPLHIRDDAQRFELHRVWVIEGTLKEGMRHAYKKRRLYIDEDTWIALLADQYDHSDRLWRTSLSHTLYRDSLPGVWKVADIFYDLRSRSYFLQAMAGAGEDSVKYSTEPRDNEFFSPSALRRQSVR